jgi:hypothetical protein
MDRAVDRTLDFFVEFQALKLRNKGNPLDPTASVPFFLIEFFLFANPAGRQFCNYSPILNLMVSTYVPELS